MATLAVIPARLGSTRLPRKPLQLLGGEPLVVQVWRHAMRLAVASRCVVATDSGEVLDVCRNAGVDACLTGSHHQTGTDRIAEVARHPDFDGYDIIVNIQGDEPFIPEAVVRGALSLVEDGTGDALGTVAVAATVGELNDPNIVKVVVGGAGTALYFSRAPIPFLRSAADADALAGQLWRHVGIYAYTRGALDRWVRLAEHPLERIERLEQLRPLAAGIPIRVARLAIDVPPGIDTENDLESANLRWQAFSSQSNQHRVIT